MELLATLADLVLRLDVHLGALASAHGAWIYAILFAVIFAETGLVVTPFLPGDSLLFVAGGVAALGGMDIHLLVAALVAAAVLGNTVNYSVGRWLGTRYFDAGRSRWIRREYLDRTHAFYERHGGLAVVISRFVPIIRTYVPFVAGLARMSYGRFTAYNAAGAVIWVASLCYAGYFFGNLPWVKANLSLIIVGIIAASVAPLVLAWWRERRA
ncbi:MAG TPA: DedA family protein [Usitatibacteraceae bacterium]|nr:DedA family protein [Usitatibacteraceae bacterium]